jgi:hypothetical protein
MAAGSDGRAALERDGYARVVAAQLTLVARHVGDVPQNASARAHLTAPAGTPVGADNNAPS